MVNRRTARKLVTKKYLFLKDIATDSEIRSFIASCSNDGERYASAVVPSR